MSRQPQRATDGISKNPEHATTAIVVYTDWEALKREFLLNDTHHMVATWLQEIKGWPTKKIRNGQTFKKTKGWRSDREAFQQQKTQQLIEAALEAERRSVPTLRAAKAALIRNVVGDIAHWRTLNAKDKALIYQILKVELREPTNVKDLPPAGAKDPVEALLEEFGMMEEGEVIIDDSTDESDDQAAGGVAIQEAATTSSDAPVEIPQS